jgi:hypothetical protein
VVRGSDEIYFYNSISAESGPWAYSPFKRTVTEANYGVRKISDRLAQALNEVLDEGPLPARLSYRPEDIEGTRV